MGEDLMKINMKEMIKEYFYKSSLSTIQKQRIVKEYRFIKYEINRLLGRKREFGNISFIPLVESNINFGNEYLIRRYAGVNEDLYAIIEHGLFFGNNTKKVLNPFEYDLGCILTYGEYRKELIQRVFSDFYCETIGAPILYADDEETYRQKIISELQISGRILLFFPVHGVIIVKPKFDENSLADQLLSIASENGCSSIIICSYQLTPSDDLYQTLTKKAKDIKVYIYSCGHRYDQEFLFRQRALISLSSITASNGLGTHVGNCVGLQKPHAIIKQEIHYEGDVEAEFGEQVRGENWKEQYAAEQALFEKTFPYTTVQLTLTEEQYKLCDYYWGFSKKKTPEEIREIYHKCREHAYKFSKHKIT